MAETISLLPLDSIELRPDIEVRIQRDSESIEDYADLYRDADDLGPLDVFFDGDVYWLADGFMRFSAARRAGLTELPCRIHEGTKDDAAWFACSANTKNGQGQITSPSACSATTSADCGGPAPICRAAVIATREPQCHPITEFFYSWTFFA